MNSTITGWSIHADSPLKPASSTEAELSSMKKNGTSGNTGGFSLIEVTIAMAIASVALVTLMGLIPQGMDTMREAGDQAIMGRIHQQVMSELQMADFEALNKFDGMEIFYDGQGEELSDSRNQGDATADRKKGALAHIYSARISIPDDGKKAPESVGGTTFTGSSFDRNGNLLVRPAIIEVAAVSGLAENFTWNENNRNMIHSYQTNLVKMGKTFSEPAP